jgi:hypothetical protein
MDDFKQSIKWVDIATFPLKKSLLVSEVIIKPDGTLIPNLQKKKLHFQ